MHQVDEQRVPWYDLRKLLPGPWLETDIELTDSEWEKDPDEPDSHVGEVYEAAPRPRMVQHAPRGEGLYYVRIPGYPIRVVDVYRRGRIWLGSWSDIPEFAVATSGYEFSDRPLPDPVEP